MQQIFFIRALLVCAVMLMLCQPLAYGASTSGAYTFRSYGPEQGLRNQAVTGMAQDKDGFIFAATEDGLFRYDGKRFERFGKAEGLLGDSIIHLYREPGGRLWVLNSKGAVAWAGSGLDPSVKSSILPGTRIVSMSATLSGHLVLATDTEIYEGQPDKLVPVKGLPKVGGRAVWIAPDGTDTLVATKGELYHRGAGGQWAVRALPPGVSSELIHNVLKDGRGRIWIRGQRVMLRLNTFESAIEDLAPQLPGAAILNGPLALDLQGRVWTTTSLGVVRMDDKGAWVLGEHQGLPSQGAGAILFDREGNLWISSEGVHRLQGRLEWTAETRRQKLPSDTVWNVARTGDGVLWIGTTRGLAQSTDKGWVVLPGTEDRIIYSTAMDAAGNFWAAGNKAKGAPHNTLLMRASGGSTFRSIALGHMAGPSTVNSMDFGRDDALYLGTEAQGLHRMVRRGDNYEGEKVILPKGEPREQINQVLRDAKGRLWVAGMNGLAFFDGVAWKRFGLQDGLRDLHVEAVAVDHAGDLMVSYWDVHGLTHFNTNAKGVLKATQIDKPDGLVTDNIYSMGYDVHGALWLGTAQGVKRWKDGRMEQFGRGEGLPGDDANANAFWVDANGDVWFGMTSGLAHYHASERKMSPPLPATRVLRVEDGNGKILTAPIPQVAWENRTLTFRFAALSFLNEMRIRPQVRLAGFEDAWRDTDIREARYTGLPPGRYRFEVRASMGGDEFGAVSVREVDILPPWWRTIWALILGALAGAALLFLFMRWRHGRLERRNEELAGLVRARTSELELANGALHDASMIDPLTGLKNRRFLGLSMPDELARVSRQYRAKDNARANVNKTLLFVMVDLDHFKSVNDTYGHAAGDLVLQAASAALRDACREADFVVRWGGEEFLIVARNSDRDCANLLATNLRDAMRNLRIDIGNGVILQKTCSLGFAAFPVLESAPEAYAWEDVVKMADQCLYAAKNSGRDAWVGVVLPSDALDPGPRMVSELGKLVADGGVTAATSLAPGKPLKWH